MEDREIIRLYWDRDENAIKETAGKYGAKLLAMGRHMVSPEDAEECVNDTYLAAWNRIPPTRPVYLFAWLAKVCRNAICHRISWMHAQKRKAEMVPLEEELAACLPSGSSTEEEVDARELGKFLTTFLQNLPKEKRLIFMRRYWFGDSVSEIAERFGLGESKVKVTLYRTREKLKSELTKEGYGA